VLLSPAQGDPARLPNGFGPIPDDPGLVLWCLVLKDQDAVLVLIQN